MSKRGSLGEIQIPSGVISGLNVTRLNKIQDEEGAFVEFFQSLDLRDLKSVQSRHDELLARNRQLAVENCELQPKFEEKRAKLVAQSIEAAELKQEYDRRFQQLSAASKQGDNSAQLKELQAAVKSSEKEAEELADHFFAKEDGVGVDEFLTQYSELRRLYWLRRVKAEKMEELIRNRTPKPAPRHPRATTASESRPQPPYVAPLSNVTHSLPSSAPSSIPYPPNPAQSAPPYPPGPIAGRPPHPGQSLPPYPPGPAARMPSPHPPAAHPFPAAAYYRQAPPPHPSHPPRPPPAGRPPYPPYGYR